MSEIGKIYTLDTHLPFTYFENHTAECHYDMVHNIILLHTARLSKMFLVWRLKFIVPHKFCLIEEGWFWPQQNINQGLNSQKTPHNSPSQASHGVSIVNTVWCCYNAVNFLKNSHNRHPIARPWGRGMGCLLWAWSLIFVPLLSSQWCM